MLEPIEKLLILQNTDQRIRDVTLALHQLPLEKATAEKALQQADQRLEEIRSRQQEHEVQLKKLQGDVLSKREQISRYRTQQLATRKNDEYAAFNHEIAVGEATIVTLEDRQLILMEEAETLAFELQTAQEVDAIERQRIHTLLGTLDARRANLLARQTEFREERPRLTVGIEEDLLERYDRLFKSKDGTAVVPLEHGVCTGCHMQMTTQTVISTKAEKEMTSCSQCGRILYTEED